MIASSNSPNSAGPSSASETFGQTPPGARPDAPGPGPHPLEPLIKQLGLLREFALHYVEAQKDAVTATIRNMVLKAVLGAFAAVVALTLLIASSVLLIDGLAELIGVAAGDRPWVGKLAMGGGVLLLFGVATAWFVSRQIRSARKRTIRKYENRHDTQRARYGADVTQRAAL